MRCPRYPPKASLLAICLPSALPIVYYTHYTMKLLFSMVLAQLLASAAGQTCGSVFPQAGGRCGDVCMAHGGAVRNGPLQPYAPPQNTTEIPLAACVVKKPEADTLAGPETYSVGTKTGHPGAAPCRLPNGQVVPYNEANCCCKSA